MSTEAGDPLSRNLAIELYTLKEALRIADVQTRDLREALHNLVEACFKADNAGDLASEIDGSLMDAAWAALRSKPDNREPDCKEESCPDTGTHRYPDCAQDAPKILSLPIKIIG